MSKQMMFNGRLNKNEANIWLDLLQEANKHKLKDRDLARNFLDLPETISFVSSVDKKIIGGTTIYRDRTRLSMVLVSVAVREAYRETATYQIVKASLPFFKTVAIRDVDVLVSTDSMTDPIGFPLSFEVDSWTLGMIENAGFKEVSRIGQYAFDVSEDISCPIEWDIEPNRAGAKELIWDQSKPLGLTTSLVWVARDFAAANGNLFTYSIEDKTAAVFGLWSIGDSLIVSLLVTDPEVLEWSQVAGAILTEGTKRGSKTIHLPLVGAGQAVLIEELERRANLISSRKLSLLRKAL